MYAFGSSVKRHIKRWNQTITINDKWNSPKIFKLFSINFAVLQTFQQRKYQSCFCLTIHLVFRRSTVPLSSQIIPLSCAVLGTLEHHFPCSPFWFYFEMVRFLSNKPLSADYHFIPSACALYFVDAWLCSTRWSLRFIKPAVYEMITEDISRGKEKVKVPVVNELNDETPTEFGVR